MIDSVNVQCRWCERYFDKKRSDAERSENHFCCKNHRIKWFKSPEGRQWLSERRLAQGELFKRLEALGQEA